MGRKSTAEDGPKSDRSKSVRGSPERSKSEMKFSPRTPVFQRSQSSPLSDRSEKSGKSKSYRPLQSQLTHLEGETQVIREQTEVSHFTDKEKSTLSKLSEKVDVDTSDLKQEPTLPEHIEEDVHAETEGPETQKDEDETVPEQQDVEPAEVSVESEDEPREESVKEEEVPEISGEEIAQSEEGQEVESKVDDKSFEQKSGEVTPKSQKTPSQSASLISGEDVKGIPNSCNEISNCHIIFEVFLIFLHMFIPQQCFDSIFKQQGNITEVYLH